MQVSRFASWCGLCVVRFHAGAAPTQNPRTALDTPRRGWQVTGLSRGHYVPQGSLERPGAKLVSWLERSGLVPHPNLRSYVPLDVPTAKNEHPGYAAGKTDQGRRFRNYGVHTDQIQ
jgi:hypothetical protein